MKIRTAIFGVYLTASALGFTVLMAFVLKEVRPRYVESMRRTLADTAGLLAVLLEEAAVRQPADAELAGTWREALAAWARAAGGLRVYVTDARGIVTFDAGHDAAEGRNCQPTATPAAYFVGKADSATDRWVDLVSGELRVAAPVRRAGEVVGWVGVARPLSSVTEAILRARLRLVVGALAVAAIITAAGWWIAAKLTRSLERLTAYAEAVRDGRGAVPPSSRASEVAALAQAFEQMRVALEGKAYVERTTEALAHEVKAPLAAIRGSAELLEEDLPEAERRRFLAHVRTEAARLEQMVARMLRLAALEARGGLAEVELLPLAEVVAEAVEALRPVWLGRGVDMRVELAGAAADAGGAAGASVVRVRGERFLLVQAVGNLVGNALDFSPAGGRVTVRIEPALPGPGSAADRAGAAVNEGAGATAEPRVALVVEDDGPGVPAFAQARIFERFYSLPRPAGGRKSTGLGLSFVREIAGLHDGNIAVVNRPEGGARAVLTLPRV